MIAQEIVAWLVAASSLASVGGVLINTRMNRMKLRQVQRDVDNMEMINRAQQGVINETRIKYDRARELQTKIKTVIQDPELSKMIGQVETLPVPAKPFDPLDPFVDKAWCMKCPEPTKEKPYADLHPIADMRFPEFSLLWLCPECYEDFTNPEGVLDPGQQLYSCTCSVCGEFEQTEQYPATDTDGQAICSECALMPDDESEEEERQRINAREKELLLRWHARRGQQQAAVAESIPPVQYSTNTFMGKQIAEIKQHCQPCDEKRGVLHCSLCGDPMQSGYGMTNSGLPACASCLEQEPLTLSASEFCDLGFCVDCGDLIDEHDLAEDGFVPFSALCRPCQQVAPCWVERDGFKWAISLPELRDRLKLLNEPVSRSGAQPINIDSERRKRRGA